MLAKVRRIGDLLSHLRYHELKVSRSKAECLLAENFMKDVDQLNMRDKVYHFERLNSLRWGDSKKMLDISLNFHPRDILTDADISIIARDYMERIGLHKQPYLLYRHRDVGHPHAHVVTSIVQSKGKRIDISPRLLHQMKSICREFETRHSLVPPGRGMTAAERQSDKAQRVIYGQGATMPALSAVINRVIPQYRYTSLNELNAVLRLYNVEAYRGKPDSHLYRHRGLIYRVLNEKGSNIGSTIKASLFDTKPTLAQLEKRFVLNQAEAERPQNRQRVTMVVELALRKGVDLPGLQKKLEKEQMSLVMLKDKVGGSTESYFVDHQNQTVYPGRVLGVGYDRQALEQLCVPTELLREAQSPELVQRKDQRVTINSFLQ